MAAVVALPNTQKNHSSGKFERGAGGDGTFDVVFQRKRARKCAQFQSFSTAHWRRAAGLLACKGNDERCLVLNQGGSMHVKPQAGVQLALPCMRFAECPDIHYRTEPWLSD